MSNAHGTEHGGHGSKSGGSNVAGECLFGNCTEVSAAAGLVTGMSTFIFMGLLSSGGDSGHHDAGH